MCDRQGLITLKGVKKIAESEEKRGRKPAVTVEEIYELQRHGYSLAQIAEMKGISRQAVYQKIRNDEKKKGLITPVDEAVRKLANPSTREIANKMGDEKVKRFVAYHVDLFKMGQGCDKKDVPGLYERFGKYLAYCTEHGVVPNNMSAYLAIGVYKTDISNWSKGIDGTPDHQRFAREVQAFFSAIHEQGGTDGVMNPIQTIFWQKAYDGLSDQPKVEIEVTNPLGEKRSAEDIAQAYGEVELPD